MENNNDVQTIPILPSLNIKETTAFYQDTLGFEVFGDYGGYLLLRRDGVELHFWLTEDSQLPDASSCYIRGGKVVAFYEEFSKQSFSEGKLSEFLVRPWNMKEFYVHDPHGNLLRFGCAPEECD